MSLIKNSLLSTHAVIWCLIVEGLGEHLIRLHRHDIRVYLSFRVCTGCTQGHVRRRLKICCVVMVMVHRTSTVVAECHTNGIHRIETNTCLIDEIHDVCCVI